MEIDYKKSQSYSKAQKRVEEMKGFYVHFTVYCLVIPIIIAVNLIFVPHFHWFWFSVLGWGFGLFFHWLNVFGFQKLGFGKKWEEEKIKEFMNKNEY